MNKLDESMIVNSIHAECMAHITLTQEAASRFFKTSKGSYSENDAFLGITVPNLRKIAKKYQYITLNTIKKLLKSKYNEERLLALFILVNQYKKSDTIQQEMLCKFYIENLKYVNNWNLVDASAYFILGHYLWEKDKCLLNKMAKSDVLWEQRVSIVATWYFIRKGQTDTTFDIAKILLNHKHDLIQKAVGWMLREAGKKDEKGLLGFLSQHLDKMPKTMLRYAMERLTNQQKADLVYPATCDYSIVTQI